MRKWTVSGLVLAIALVGTLLRSTSPTQAEAGNQFEPNVVVRISSPEPGARVTGLVEIAGYAADPRVVTFQGPSPSAPSDCRSPRLPSGLCSSGLNEDDVQLWLNDTADPRNRLDYAKMGSASADAAATLGASFAHVGFRQEWQTCSFSPGRYRLLAFVSSLATIGAGGSTSVDLEIGRCPAGTILHRDDFAAQPGGVQTITGAERGSSRSASIAPIFADFAVGIDAQCPRLSGEDWCAVALAFRLLNNPFQSGTSATGYIFEVDQTDGTFRVNYLVPQEGPSSFERLVRETQSSAIRRGTGFNRLAVISQGDWLRFFVNGERVAELRDDRQPWGGIVWGGVGRSARPIDVQFDNLVVSTVGPVEALGPALRAE